MTIESYSTAALYGSAPCQNQIFEMGEFMLGKLAGQDLFGNGVPTSLMTIWRLRNSDFGGLYRGM